MQLGAARGNGKQAFGVDVAAARQRDGTNVRAADRDCERGRHGEVAVPVERYALQLLPAAFGGRFDPLIRQRMARVKRKVAEVPLR